MTREIQSTNSNLPQSKEMPKWGPDYLAALEKTKGALTTAAKFIGKDYSTTYKARLAYPKFAQAVDDIKAVWDSRNLAELEEISLEQAKKPGNVTERIFRMKAYHPGKYREKTIPTPPNINIVFGKGLDYPDITESAREVTADYCIAGSGRKRNLIEDELLTDEDLEI